jgi:hypothetical protein
VTKKQSNAKYSSVVPPIFLFTESNPSTKDGHLKLKKDKIAII